MAGDLTGRDPARPAGDERHAVAAFPNAELETKKVTVLSMSRLEGRLPAEVEHAAVITGKDD